MLKLVHKADNNAFPIALVFHEKQGDRIEIARTKENMYSVCLAIVEERLAIGYYEDQHSIAKAGRIVEEKAGHEALTFLIGRSNAEYEGLTFHHTTNLPPMVG